MALLALHRPALAGPSGGSVVAGSASIAQSGATTTINQSSNAAIINWQSFSIGSSETVTFHQPSSQAATLNRVIGNEASVISGALNANGQVFIVNSAGVLFTKGAQVNVGGLVASTLDIADSDFLSGHYTFAGSSSASVVNAGRIHADPGGYVALLGKTVSNTGTITATLGTVAMASGDKITLNFEGNSLVDVTIDQGTLNALVENKGLIKANGGQVILTAKAADAVLSAQVNNSGIIQARTMSALKGGRTVVHTGSIKLIASGGTVNVAGKLDASAPKGGNGGTIETSGDKVEVADGALITTLAANGASGTWLIDPTDFTVVSGSAAETSSGIGAATLDAALASGSVTIATASGGTDAGDIDINSGVTWAANTTLTLNAANEININAPITATGAKAGLVMNYSGDYNILTPATYSGVGAVAPAGVVYASVTLSGLQASLTINGSSYSLIHSMSDLAAITGTGRYALAQDLDASGTVYSSAVVANLNGTLAGLGHTISNLSITNTTQSAPDLALIGTTTAGSLIRDIGIVNVSINAGTSNYAGALVGTNLANISKAYSTGVVNGNNSGGLIGYNGTYPNPGVFNTISDSFSNVAVTGNEVGGLIGRTEYVNIYRSHATGNLTGGSYMGGLIGYASNTNVYDSYATGSLAGTAGSSALGGLIGNVASGVGPLVIDNSYATGKVTGGYELGGLVGMLSSQTANLTIENSYATGDVTSNQSSSVATNPGIGGLVGTTSSGNVATIYILNSHASGNVAYTGTFGTGAGGLVGYMSGHADIENSYATGNVTGAAKGSGVGGLVGTGSATNISNSYATGNVTGYLTVGGLVGGNSGAITNSYATGNVIGSSNNVGGLVGTNTGSVADSYATGSVTGTGATTATGGLVGTNAGSIADSYASGVVTGPAGYSGGIAGVSYNNSGSSTNTTNGSITDSYYNSQINSGLPITNSSSCCKAGIVNGGGGLTTAQFKDISAYLNGTINTVLANRAAAAAAAEAAAAAAAAGAEVSARAAATVQAAQVGADAANVIGTTNALQSETQPAALDSVPPSIDDNLKVEGPPATTPLPTPSVQPRAERERRSERPVKTARKSAPQRKGPGYGATIRSIEINGERFDINKSKPAPEQNSH